MIYASWDINCNRHIFLSYLAIFCSFTPLTAQKMKISQIEKMPGDIIILHKCTKNHDHRLYCSGDIVWKKHLEISSFYTNVPKSMIIGYTVSEIWCMTDVIIILLGDFLPFYPSNSQKMKIPKKIENASRYHHFTQVYQNSWSYAILLLRYGAWQMYCCISFWAIFYPFTPLTARKI